MSDQFKNSAHSFVATAPSPATSGTSVTVTSGQGGRFPTPPFNVTIWPVGQVANVNTNAEIATCTNRVGDVLTIVRAQEGSSARAVVAGDQIAETITKTMVDSLEEHVSLLRFMARGDGTTDDTAAVMAALAAGVKLTGNGRIYAVNGEIELPSGTILRDAEFKQMSPDASPAGQTITLVSDGADNLDLRRIRVNRNGDGTSGGSINTSAGIRLEGGSGHILEDVEVYGDDIGSGLVMSGCSNFSITRPYVHDMNYALGSDPGDDQINGIWFNACSNFHVISARVENLGGDFGSGATTEYTRGLVLGGCSDFSIIAHQVSDVDQGMDLTGSAGNTRFRVIGGSCVDCRSHGMKFANSASDGMVIGATATRCGFHGFVVSGAAEAGIPRCEDITFIACKSISIGSNGFHSGENITGFAVLVGGFETSRPCGIRFVECEARDEQGSPTMKYGFRNDVVPSASNPKMNRMIGCNVVGATVSDTLGYIGDYRCSLSRTSTDQTIAHNTATEVIWNNEIEDPYELHASNGTTITAFEAGIYQILARLEFAANATGQRIATVKIAGGDAGVRSIAYGNASTPASLYISVERRLTKDQTVSIEVFQDSGGDLALSHTVSSFEVRKVYGAF